MPGAATSSAQVHQATGPKSAQKSQAPSPPRGALGEGPSRSNNGPDVTADIVDIYNPGDEQPEVEESDRQSVVPDYPMDSLPRHTSTQSLPGRELHIAAVSSAGVARTSQSSHAQTHSHQVPRTSTSVPASQAVVSRVGLSSSTGSIPSHTVPVATSVITHVPSSQIPIQASSHVPMSHSHSNISVNVSHVNAGPVPISSSASDPRQIRTQDLSVGVVTRLDHQRQSGQMLPDVVAHSQPPPRHQSTQRPGNLPLGDPRLSGSREVRRVVDHHPRHRSHHDHRPRSRRHSHRHRHPSDEPQCGSSCHKCLATCPSFRWILVVLSLLGVCCVVTGIVLAALHAAGNSFLFLAIMFIGKLAHWLLNGFQAYFNEVTWHKVLFDVNF